MHLSLLLREVVLEPQAHRLHGDDVDRDDGAQVPHRGARGARVGGLQPRGGTAERDSGNGDLECGRTDTCACRQALRNFFHDEPSRAEQGRAPRNYVTSSEHNVCMHMCITVSYESCSSAH